jgi:hypothetical protein
MLLFLPLNYFMGRVYVRLQKNLMKARDERVSLMNEARRSSAHLPIDSLLFSAQVLGAIRTLKASHEILDVSE